MNALTHKAFRCCCQKRLGRTSVAVAGGVSANLAPFVEKFAKRAGAEGMTMYLTLDSWWQHRQRSNDWTCWLATLSGWEVRSVNGNGAAFVV